MPAARSRSSSLRRFSSPARLVCAISACTATPRATAWASAFSTSRWSNRKIAISTLRFAPLIALIRAAAPSPGCINSAKGPRARTEEDKDSRDRGGAAAGPVLRAFVKSFIVFPYAGIVLAIQAAVLAFLRQATRMIVKLNPFISGLVVLALTFPVTGAIKKKEDDSAQSGPAIFWRDPGDISSRDLYFGPGGRQHEPHGPYTFVKEDMAGSNPKFVVKD